MNHVTIKNHPTRLVTALTQLAKLNELGIFLLPIRHHSPACAYATRQALQVLQPSHILIEAPVSFNELLPELQHPDNKPPLAVLCQTQVSIDNDKRLSSAYFPFCDYSPEWVALRHKNHSPKSNKSQSIKAQSIKAQKISPKIDCIDLAWSEQIAHKQYRYEQGNHEHDNHEQTSDTYHNAESADWQTQSLQQERYLAHSQYIKALADKLHCRDHDEVWEHLFELDGVEQLQDWQGFFHKVLVWCAMSRLDYEEEVLEVEGSLVREQHMIKRIIDCYQSQRNDKKQNKKIIAQPIVIVTGGFHTLALIEEVYAVLIDTSTSKKSVAQTKIDKTSKVTPDESWLIRYSFDRLDALNGYASGMPSPAFYQACWEEMTAEKIDDKPTHHAQTRQSLIIDFLSDFSKELRAEHIIQSSYITVKTASEQAIRLAQLREHRLIGRFDLMDACYSSFLKGSSDDGYHGFHQLLKDKLGGSRLGHVVSSNRTPPILAQVYELVKSHRFKLDDTLTKTTKLDVLRKPKHRERSSLLHLLNFLDVGFARRISGPDFLHGGQLHLLFEEWQYAWTPNVEAQLIELSEMGSDVYQLATERLFLQKQKYAEQGQNQSSAQVISLLIQALMMGLNEHSQSLFDEIATILPHDPELGSVLASGQHLMYLWAGRQFLQLQPDNANASHTDITNVDSAYGRQGQHKQQQLLDLISQIPTTAFFLLSQLQTPNDDQVAETLQHILSLRNLLKQISPIIQSVEQVTEQDLQQSQPYHEKLYEYFHKNLQRLRPNWQSIDLLMGAVDALAFVDEFCTEEELANRLKQNFGTGANPEQAVQYLSGMMQAVPTLFLHYQGMTTMLNQLISQWDNDTFVSLLPDLRLAFTGLKPMQTNEFAEQVANLHGVSSTHVSNYQGQMSEEDMMQGVALNQQLEKVLSQHGLITKN